LWAVLVAGIGMARPQFPGGLGGQRAVIAVTVVLAAVVMGVAVQVALRNRPSSLGRSTRVDVGRPLAQEPEIPEDAREECHDH